MLKLLQPVINDTSNGCYRSSSSDLRSLVSASCAHFFLKGSLSSLKEDRSLVGKTGDDEQCS